jgi:ABC-type siderophore export system fused ATPase/permease subunit
MSKLGYLARKLVVMKYTLQRGYSWVNVMLLSVIGAASIKPYLPNWNLYVLGISAFVLIFMIGLIDKYFGFLNAEANYGVEVTPLLMKGLKGELNQDNQDKNKKEQDEKIQKDMQNGIKKD